MSPPPMPPRDGRSWKIVRAGLFGPVKIDAAGNVSVGDTRFDQSATLTSVPIGDCVVTKNDDTGGTVVIETPNKTHRLMYRDEVWFYSVEKKSFWSRLFG